MKRTPIIVVFLYVLYAPSLFADIGFKFPTPDPTKSANEQIHIFNIPDTILTRMSTEELATTCADWPYMLLSLISFNTDQQKVNFMWEHFNGLRELFSRPDSGTVLLSMYEAIDMSAMMSRTVNEQTEKQLNTQIRQEFIETLLAHAIIFDKLLDSEKEKLKEAAIWKFKYAQQNMAFMGATPLENTARILLLFVNEQNLPKELDLTKSEDIHRLLNSVSQ